MSSWKAIASVQFFLALAIKNAGMATMIDLIFIPHKLPSIKIIHKHPHVNVLRETMLLKHTLTCTIMHKARKEKFSQAFKGFIQGDMK